MTWVLELSFTNPFWRLVYGGLRTQPVDTESSKPNHTEVDLRLGVCGLWRFQIERGNVSKSGSHDVHTEMLYNPGQQHS